MARKWQRMVEKNTKLTNKHRAKQGKSLVAKPKEKDAFTRFVGRTWMLPTLLVAFSMFFLIAVGGVYKDGMYWFTVLSYLFLGLFIYFLRRPFLKIGKDKISARRFTGEKFAEASDIEMITISPSYITIKIKGARTHWVFSRLFHRFNISEMATKLKQFAQQHDISLKEETK